MVNKRLETAKAKHLKWLEDQGLTRKQIKARRDKEIPAVPFPDLKVESKRQSMGNGFAKAGFVNTPMARRFGEKPEVRAEIEKKAMSIGATYNKGAAQYMTPGDKAPYQPKVRK